MDKKRNLIIQFPIFVQSFTQQPLILYQIETVPVPIVDKNTQANSYIEILVMKPYIALKLETYINMQQQDLATCKRIGYEFYYEELFVGRHKSIHSCESAIYFDLDTDIIKKNCDFSCGSLVFSGTVHWFEGRQAFHPLLWTSSGLKGTWKLSAYIGLVSLRCAKTVKNW